MRLYSTSSSARVLALTFLIILSSNFLKDLSPKVAALPTNSNLDNPSKPTSQFPSSSLPPAPFEVSYIKRIRQQLTDKSSLIIYTVGEEKTTLTLIQPDQLPVRRVLAIGSQEIQGLVEDFRRKILITATGTHSVSPWRRKNLHRAARHLFNRFLSPIDSYLEASERLLLVPDGPLYLLPWGALQRQVPKKEEGILSYQYLAQWKPISIWSTNNLLADLQGLRQRPTSLLFLDLVAFGDPDFRKTGAAISTSMLNPRNTHGRSISLFRSHPPQQRLFASRFEVQDIASLFPGENKTFLGNQATEAAVRDTAPNARFLHFATHSFFHPEAPSALALAQPITVQSESDNGLLVDHEIMRDLELDAEMVVLSSCDSGRGLETASRGVLGLVRAFQAAGARSVVASLWPVDDMATAVLMPLFYRHLQAGLPKDRALQAAQASLIGRAEELTPLSCSQQEIDLFLPIFWAAFQVYGDWT